MGKLNKEKDLRKESKKFNIKTPKGTVDFVNSECELLNFVLKKCEDIMKLYAPPLNTPIFELSDILLKKYDTTDDEYMNTYQLEKQGNERHTLRFDLTVPFARFLAQNNISKFSRYQIGKVFRRDQPVISKGRYREFYQCDFDIAGNYALMTSEAQILKMMEEILLSFKIGPFKIKINDRRILNKILHKCEIENEFSILSTIDKIKKISEKEIKEELKEKGCSEKVSEFILEIIKNKGTFEEMLIYLKNQKEFECKEIISEYEILKKYLESLSFDFRNIEFDLSLARGAAYYTGIIFEAEFLNIKEKENVGSVIGGGRYDNLVNSFKENWEVPAIGLSVGVYRILNLLKTRFKEKINKKILLVSLKDPLISERLEILDLLRKNEISCQTNFINRLNLADQIKFGKKNGFSSVIILKNEEIKERKVRVLKDIEKKDEELILLEDLINFIKQMK